MSQTRRWSLCVALVALVAPSAVARTQQATLVLLLQSPNQLIEIPDDDGRLRLWRFQANARVYDSGRATGGMTIERGSEQYEFAFRSASYVLDGERVTELTLVGRGEQSTGAGVKLKDEGFGFVEMVTESPTTPGVLVYDIEDGSVYTKPPFEAEGTLTVAP